MPKKYIARIVQLDTLTDTFVRDYEIKVDFRDEADKHCEDLNDTGSFMEYFVGQVRLNREDG